MTIFKTIKAAFCAQKAGNSEADLRRSNMLKQIDLVEASTLDEALKAELVKALSDRLKTIDSES